MSRLAVLRSLMNKQTTSCRQKQGFLLWNLRYCVRFASSNAGNQTAGQDFDREAFNRRQKRLVAAIIGSSVGLIGSSYCLYRKLSKAKAESPSPSIDSRNSSSESTSAKGQEDDDEETDGKRKKDKQGFRERRVRKEESALSKCFVVGSIHVEGVEGSKHQVACLLEDSW